MLANELTRMGRHQQNGSYSPPPPAPPPRDTSIMSAVDEASGSHDGTLLASEPGHGHQENLSFPFMFQIFFLSLQHTLFN